MGLVGDGLVDTMFKAGVDTLKKDLYACPHNNTGRLVPRKFWGQTEAKIPTWTCTSLGITSGGHMVA